MRLPVNIVAMQRDVSQLIGEKEKAAYYAGVIFHTHRRLGFMFHRLSRESRERALHVLEFATDQLFAIHNKSTI